MPRDQEVIALTDDAYTEITDNAAVSSITFQAVDRDIFIRYTEDGTPPDSSEQGYEYRDGQGEADRATTDFTSWVAPSRVWAMAIQGRGSSDVDARVIVTHA